MTYECEHLETASARRSGVVPSSEGCTRRSRVGEMKRRATELATSSNRVLEQCGADSVASPVRHHPVEQGLLALALVVLIVAGLAGGLKS